MKLHDNSCYTNSWDLKETGEIPESEKPVGEENRDCLRSSEQLGLWTPPPPSVTSARNSCALPASSQASGRGPELEQKIWFIDWSTIFNASSNFWKRNYSTKCDVDCRMAIGAQVIRGKKKRGEGDQRGEEIEKETGKWDRVVICKADIAVSGFYVLEGKTLKSALLRNSFICFF